jgi:predicted small lipoprotein YifL
MMKTVMILIALSLSLAACGVRGDPQAATLFQQAQ